jgi:hypothetical protein
MGRHRSVRWHTEPPLHYNKRRKILIVSVACEQARHNPLPTRYSLKIIDKTRA